MSLAEIITEQKLSSFTDPSTATDAEALGIAIASHFHWDGLAIMRTFAAALEDANFHTESAVVSGWVEAEEGE